MYKQINTFFSTHLLLLFLEKKIFVYCVTLNQMVIKLFIYSLPIKWTSLELHMV